MERRGKSADLPKITPKRVRQGVVRLNYAPIISLKYIEQWNEELRKDESAAKEVKAVMEDVLAMLKIAMNVMTPKDYKDMIPMRPDAVNNKN